MLLTLKYPTWQRKLLTVVGIVALLLVVNLVGHWLAIYLFGEP